MKSGSQFQRIAIAIGLMIAVTLVGSPAVSWADNYVLKDGYLNYKTEPTFTGTATSYTGRDVEPYSVGYYIENGLIAGDYSLFTDKDGDADDLSLDIFAFDNISDYSDASPNFIFNPVLATGEGTDLTLSGSIHIFDNSDGAIASDFSGRGAAILASNGAKVNVEGMKIFTNGFVRAALISDEYAQLNVRNSDITVMGANPLTDVYESYDNSADQNLMISPPWVLGIQGGARLANMLGAQSTLTVINSKCTAGGWGVLSTDAGNNFVMNVVNSELEILPASRGGMSSGNFDYSGDYGSGYGTYIIGKAKEYFYGTYFKGTTYASILTGGDGYYMSSRGKVELTDAMGNAIDTICGRGRQTVIQSVFGFMAHNSGSINVLDGTVVKTEEATFLYKAGDVNYVVDKAVLRPKSGIILQMIDNDDSTVGLSNAPPPPPDSGIYWAPIFNSEFFEEPGWPSENGNDIPNMGSGPFGPPMPNTVSLNLTNGKYTGDVFNGTGYYTQLGDVLQVTIGPGATLRGTVSLTETRHIDENGDQNTSFPIEKYYYLGHVENRNHRNDYSTISVVIDSGVWQVTGESLISSLLVENGAIKGAGGKNAVMTVDGVATAIKKGQLYEGDIIISLENRYNNHHSK